MRGHLTRFQNHTISRTDRLSDGTQGGIEGIILFFLIKYNTQADITKATPRGSGSIHEIAGPTNKEVSYFLGFAHYSKLDTVSKISFSVII
jgi:hypothetical protein